MEDIGPDGNWRRSHSFEFAGQLIQHVAGESAKGMMREWVKLRSELGEELFQELRVWSQPAAWADEVIHCWLVEVLGSLVTQSINVCDCFAGQWTPRVLESSWLSQMAVVPVGPDCTPILQVADVAVIGPAKSAGERRKAELNQLLELKAEREGVPFRGQFGKYEIFEVARSMVEYQTKLQSQRDGVLECLLRTQCLALRPRGKRLELVDGQEWLARSGLSRSPQSAGLQARWVQSRLGEWYSQESETPVPPVPEWDSIGSAFMEDSPVPAEFSSDPSPLVITVGDLPPELSSKEVDQLLGPEYQRSLVQLLQVDNGYVAEGASRRTPVPAGTARLMAAVTASLGQARRAEAGRDVVVEFDESVASCEGADGAMVDGSLIVLLMLLLAAAIFGVLLGYCVRAALDPATTVARRTPQTRRTVATQSMVTYRREWATPRFTVLPDDLQGTFGEQIG